MTIARLCLLILLALPLSLRAEVLDAADNGFTVENRAEVPVSAMAVWKALIEDVDRWWPKDHSYFGAEGRFRIEPRAGGCFCEKAGEREVQHLQVSHVDPGKLLRLLGGLGPLQSMGLHGVLDWQLEALSDKRTRITLRHRVGGYTPNSLQSFAPVVDSVQAIQLGGLAKQLGGQLLESSTHAD